jgi:hypothetical protein
MALQKHEPGLCSETCHTSSGDCNQVVGIKVEDLVSIKEEEIPEPISFPKINTEHELSCTSVSIIMHILQILRTTNCLSYLHLSVSVP